MKKVYVMVMLSMLCALPSQVFAESTEEAAIMAAEKWLILVDTNEFGKSWEQASELFRKSITPHVGAFHQGHPALIW